MATHYNRPLCDSLCRIDSENKIMVYIKHSIESIQTICSMLVYCRYNYFLPSCINTAKLLDFCCEYLKHAHHTNTFQTILLNSILVGVTYNYVMFKSFVYLTWIWPKLCRKHVGISWHISKRAVSAIDIAKKKQILDSEIVRSSKFAYSCHCNGKISTEQNRIGERNCFKSPEYGTRWWTMFKHNNFLFFFFVFDF